MAVLILSVVSKKAKRGAPLIHKILQAVNELVRWGDSFNLENMRLPPKENLSINETAINSWGVA